MLSQSIFMLKKIVYKCTNTIYMLSHIYQVSAQKWVFVFFGVFSFYYQKTNTRKTFGAGGEERRNGCIRMVRPWSNSFRFIDNWRSYTYHCRLEVSPSDFDNILRLLLSVGVSRKSESLVNFIDQYYDLFFLVRLRSRQPFRDVFRTEF